MPNKTICLPDEVIPIIEILGEPFSTWVRDQLLKQRTRQDDGGGRLGWPSADLRVKTRVVQLS